MIMENRKATHRALFLAALGAVSCATPAKTPLDTPNVITVDRQDFRHQVVADTVRNRFAEVFNQADKEFDKLYEDRNR